MSPGAAAHGQVPDPRAVIERLAGCDTPWLIGVRHHSPLLARAVPQLLDHFGPEVVAIELPLELEPWLEWLGDPATESPVALSVASLDGSQLGFYPFADFSPELAAIRWARANQVEVVAIDLPAGIRNQEPDDGSGAGPGQGRVLPALLRSASVSDAEELWDRRIEAPGAGAPPERVRRSALGLGWAMRFGASEATAVVPPLDRRREGWMRRRLAELAGRRTAAVIGAFHAAALLPEPLLWSDPDHRTTVEQGARELATAMIPYSFDLLDSRSGYPAGIRDPEWQQAVLEAAAEPDGISAAASRALVAIGAQLRLDGHAAGVPDATEATRLASDLARLRGLPAPGRRELIEALTTTMTHGERLGRGRAVARAAERVLVGHREGRLPAGAPRSGLGVAVSRELEELGLPTRGGRREEVDLRLDPAPLQDRPAPPADPQPADSLRGQLRRAAERRRARR